jgi:hypothetical protein
MKIASAPAVRWTFSAADRVAACPASAALPQARRAGSADATRGTAIHAFLRDLVVDGSEQALARVPASAEHRAVCEALSVGGLEKLWRGGGTWCEASYAYSPAARTSRFLGLDIGRGYQVEAHEVAGTIDLVASWPHDEEPPLVLDWKTGHHPPRAQGNGQLLLGALCVWCQRRTSSIRTAIVHIDDAGAWHVDEHVLDRAALEEGAERVMQWHAAAEAAREQVLAGVVPDVVMGPHCRYCAAIASCPGQAGALRMLLGGDALQLDVVTTADAGRAWQMATDARRALDEVERALRARVDAEGLLPLPDGSVVRPVEMTRESLDVPRALAVVEMHLGAEARAQADGLIKRSIGKAELLSLAGRTTSAKNSLLSALRAAGATHATSTTSYRTGTPKEEKL